MPPIVSRPAPDFVADTVVNQEFKEIKLSDFRGKKYVVLFFCESCMGRSCSQSLIAF